MSVTVKLVDGTEKQVELPDLSITVTQLKEITAPVVNIPADEQRIVLKGKVLKEHDVLSAVGLEYGNALHVVRSKKKETTAAAQPSQPTSVPATTSSTPSAPVATGPAAAPNPYAALLGGGFGAPAPMSSGFGGTGGVPSPWGAAPGAAPGVGYSPEMMQMVQQATQDPNFIEYLRHSNPMLASMSPEMIQQMTQMMASNPQMMNQMMSMSGGAAGQQQGGMPGATGMPTGMAPPSSGFNFNPAAFGAPQPQGNPREIYRDQLQQLRDMGFPNEEANIAALQQSQGSVSFAIERLLGSL